MRQALLDKETEDADADHVLNVLQENKSGLKTFGDLNYMGLKLHFWITCVLQAVSSLVDSEEETKVKEKLDADSCCSKRQKVNDDDDDNP